MSTSAVTFRLKPGRRGRMSPGALLPQQLIGPPVERTEPQNQSSLDSPNYCVGDSCPRMLPELRTGFAHMRNK